MVDDWLEQDLFAGLAKGSYQMRQDDVLETRTSSLAERRSMTGLTQ